MRARFLSAIILISLPSVRLRGQADSVRPPKPNCFRPQPASACRAYFVFELTAPGRIPGFWTDVAIGPLLAQQQSQNLNQGVVEGFGLTAETALGNRGLASVVLSGDAIRVEGRTAAALHAGARLESFPALGGAVLLGIGVIALIAALSHGGFN